jgi:RNA polymerase sigma factor (sigma-70 family)
VFTTYQETSENIDDDQESDHIKSSVNRVELVLTKLPVQQAMIVKLYYYEGLEHAEIANYLNISEANSRTSLSRAKETMRKLLKL